jgi:hypothetical protein
MCNINITCRIAATLYILETGCFRYIRVNTVHKGDGGGGGTMTATFTVGCL